MLHSGCSVAEVVVWDEYCLADAVVVIVVVVVARPTSCRRSSGPAATAEHVDLAAAGYTDSSQSCSPSCGGPERQKERVRESSDTGMVGELPENDAGAALIGSTRE